MRSNPRIAQFLDKLADAGVSYRRNWEGRRDGERVGRTLHPDVFHLAFIGSGFSPSIGTAIVVDYGERDGFGLYLESDSSTIDADVAKIARPRGAKPSLAERVRLYAQEYRRKGAEPVNMRHTADVLDGIADELTTILSAGEDAGIADELAEPGELDVQHIPVVPGTAELTAGGIVKVLEQHGVPDAVVKAVFNKLAKGAQARLTIRRLARLPELRAILYLMLEEAVDDA